MSEEIQKYQINGIAVAKPILDNFLKRLSKQLNPKAIKKNQFANDAEYLEIGYIQAELDRVFHGLWSWNINQTTQMINGVQITGTLKVFHPIINSWIERSGVGFKEFQLKKDMTIPTPENLSKKALERDVPIANAEAFKNAAKTLGNAFGRGLNRKFNFEHQPDNDIINNLMPQ